MVCASTCVDAHTILFFYFAENSHFPRDGKLCNVMVQSVFFYLDIANTSSS